MDYQGIAASAVKRSTEHDGYHRFLFAIESRTFVGRLTQSGSHWEAAWGEEGDGYVALGATATQALTHLLRNLMESGTPAGEPSEAALRAARYLVAITGGVPSAVPEHLLRQGHVAWESLLLGAAPPEEFTREQAANELEEVMNEQGMERVRRLLDMIRVWRGEGSSDGP